MQKLISNHRVNDKILLNSTENIGVKFEKNEIEHKNENLKKEKKQKQRVGVNPVLGNAGVMWEAGKNMKSQVRY